MDCVQCLVRPAAGRGWTAKVGNEERGPYLSRDIATQVAIAAALQRRRSDIPARVAVVDSRGAVLAKRCLCKSFGR